MKTFNLDNYIKHHIKIDLKHSILNEKCGVPNNIDKWTNIILNTLIPYIKQFKNQYAINNKNFVINGDNYSFFNKCFLNFNGIIEDNDPNSQSVSTYGEYVPEKSGINSNGEYIISINLVVNGSIDWIINDVENCLAHELLHAYTDYCINKDIKIENKVFHSKINYKELNNCILNKNEYLRHLGDIIYFFDQNEISAMQAEMYKELNKKRNYLQTEFLVNDVFTNTEVYRRLKTTENKLNELKLLKNIKNQNLIIDSYNTIFNSKLSTYNEVLNKLNIMWSKNRNKLISSASKVMQIAIKGKDIYNYNHDD